MKTADIVIIGAGIIGLCTALQIARRSRLRIVVVDKAPMAGAGSTGASSAVCRYRYSADETVALARDGIAAYQNWSEFLELSAPTLVYHRVGMLWLDGQSAEDADASCARLTRLGVRAESLPSADLAARFPQLNSCALPFDRSGASIHECAPSETRRLFEPDAGYVEPMDAVTDVLNALRARDVAVHFNSGVTGLRRLPNGGFETTLENGDRLQSGAVVNCAGPWCDVISAMIGLDHSWPLRPTRIQVAQVDRPTTLEGALPVCADIAGGIYFRPQGATRLVIGSVLDEDEQDHVAAADEFKVFADDDFLRAKTHALAHRLGLKAHLTGVRGYSGLYTINMRDRHPIVGRTAVDGYYLANGCSGHGFKLAPAIGSLLARSLVGGADAFETAVDLAFLSPEREPITSVSNSALA